MAIQGIGGVAPSPQVSPGAGGLKKFSELVGAKPAVGSRPVGVEGGALRPAAVPTVKEGCPSTVSGVGPARAGKSVVAAPSPGQVQAQAVDRLSMAQRRMDEVLRLAQSGKDFKPAELLALQAQVYQASQELDLAGKVVEKATSGVKQVLQTQL